MGMSAIFGMWPEQFVYILANLPVSKEPSYEIWVWLAKWFLRKLCFNILIEIQYKWPQVKGQRSRLIFGTYL